MFYKPNNKIIIVDDVQTDLDDLSKQFHENGIGCKTFLYDITYSTPLKNVRIAFFDININPTGSGSDSQKFNSLANAIKQYIHAENGPYALIFWTKDADIVKDLIDYIAKRHSDCPKPFYVSYIDKTDFIQNPQEKIDAVLNDEIIELLFDFENKTSISASETINQIYNITPSTDEWGSNNNFKQNFDKIFSKISTSTLGHDHARKNPDRAVYEALLPIINYKIINNSIVENNWGKFLKEISGKNLQYPQNFAEGLLNTIFHIDNTSRVTEDIRGAVFEYNFEVTFLEKFFCSLVPYFSKLEREYKLQFSNFFTFQDSVPENIKDSIRGNSKFIIIEISSACDFSQNKSRNHKYILGLITPKFDKNFIDTKKIGNSIFYKEMPLFQLDGEDFNIWLNFNYVISDFSKNKNFGKPLFILKKEIMDMIGNRYASHVSRIGITSF